MRLPLTLPSASSHARLPALAARCASPTAFTVVSTGWEGAGYLDLSYWESIGARIESVASGGTYLDLSYWDLHGLLLIPTAWLLTAGKPTLLDEEDNPLKRTASYTFIAFILSIAVAQAFVWDSVGAQIGICECRNVFVSFLLLRSAWH